MKTILSFCLAGIIVLCGFTGKKSPDIQGAWNYVASKSVNGNKVTVTSTAMQNQMKIWTGGHFAFVGTYKHGRKVFNNYGGGTYTLNGNLYNETIVYHVDKKLVGKTIKMVIEIRNDTLIQTWPADDEGKINPASFAEEKYVRP